jgi:hypothetical protein
MEFPSDLDVMIVWMELVFPPKIIYPGKSMQDLQKQIPIDGTYPMQEIAMK